MSNVKIYLLLGLVVVLMVFGLILSFKCARLENEVVKTRLEQNTIIDSIKTENDNLSKTVNLLSADLKYYEYKIDSLKAIKQRVVIKKEIVISNNITEGVKTLKQNLKCEKR